MACAEEGKFPVHLGEAADLISLSDFFDYMPSELQISENKAIGFLVFFRNEKDKEPQIPQTSSSTPFAETKWALKERIKTVLERLGCYLYRYNSLVQFWAPLTIGGGCTLTTADQPFALSRIRKGFCWYKRICLINSYYCYANPSEIKEGERQKNLLLTGPPSRVFLNGFPEYNPNIQLYTTEEFPMRDSALKCKIECYLALPVFEPSSQSCLGVLEVVTIPQHELVWDTSSTTPRFRIGEFSSAFEEVGLQTANVKSCFDKKISSTTQISALSAIGRALSIVCGQQNILLAQTWTPSLEESRLSKVMSTTREGYYLSHKRLITFREACSNFGLMKGQGVVWRAFSSHCPCFCRDITELGIIEYPFAHIAKTLGLTSSFAICLQTNTKDDIYVLEFFLAENKDKDPRSYLNSLLVILKRHLTGFLIVSGQEQGEELKFEILRSSKDNELDSISKGQETETSITLEKWQEPNEAEAMLVQLEHQPSHMSEAFNFSALPQLFSGNAKQSFSADSKSNGINHQVLEQHFGLKLEEAACHLGVGRSTIKHFYREHGIPCWTSSKRNKGTSSSLTQRDPKRRSSDSRNVCFSEEAKTSGAHSFPQAAEAEATTDNKKRTMTIKAEQGEELKFEILRSSKDNGLDFISKGQETETSIKVEKWQEQNEAESKHVQLEHQPSHMSEAFNFSALPQSFSGDAKQSALQHFNLPDSGSWDKRYAISEFPNLPTSLDFNGFHASSECSSEQCTSDFVAEKGTYVSNEQSTSDVGGTSNGSNTVDEEVPLTRFPYDVNSLAEDEVENTGRNLVKLKEDISGNQSGKTGSWADSKSYGITREVLEQHFGLKPEEAACSLGVSRSTAKRICRELGILRWPSSKRNKGTSSSRTRKDPKRRSSDSLNVCFSEESTSRAHSFPQAAETDNKKSTMTVKAECGGKIIKFQLPSSSRMIDLEKEIAMRLKLEVGDFETSYLDEDNEWILLTCDADLEIMESVGQTKIRMSITKSGL